MNPKYPIYVISKSRPKTCLTAKEMERLGIPYYLVIEPCDVEEYGKYCNKSRFLVLPFENLNQGSIPVRNWVWEHSKNSGHLRHWVLDDNIEHFHRLNRNLKPRVDSGTIFKAAEDFVDRYDNVALAGFNYYSFCKTTDKVPPFYLNTRIYSCILIQNSLALRWRGRYNEDTDLSLRALKAGYCTILFNAFLCGKVTTMRMKGGNTDTVYTDGDNRRKFAESLEIQHPDIVKVVWKFNRWHHQVDYKPFKSNILIPRCDLDLTQIAEQNNGINNYGMVLTQSGRYNKT